MLIVILTINSPSFKKINMSVIIKSIRLATGCFLYVHFFYKLINTIISFHQMRLPAVQTVPKSVPLL